MKKFIFVLCFIFAGGFYFSPSTSHAYPDAFSNERPALWRSSSSCGAYSWAVLASSPVIIHAVSVDSATVNQGGASVISIYNSSATPNPTNAPNFISTGTMTGTNAFSSVTGIISSPPFEYQARFSTAAVVNKQGDSCTTIWWDFANPKAVDDPFLKAQYPWRP